MDTQLDKGTKLASVRAAEYDFVFYPSCGELVAVAAADRADSEKLSIPDAETNEQRASRRARTVVRRYVVHNRLDRICTLTFNDDHLPASRAEAFRVVSQFLHRSAYFDKRTPYLFVIERGTRGGRLHAHILVGRWIDSRSLAAEWKRGYVDVRRLVAKRGGGSAAERAARYASKYVSKETSKQTDREAGDHRYERSQGRNPVALSGRANRRQLERFLAGAEWSTSSEWWERYGGPHCVVLRGIRQLPATGELEQNESAGSRDGEPPPGRELISVP